MEDYKCPGCGASLVYRESSRELVCPYCGTRVEIDSLSGSEEKPRDGELYAREAKAAGEPDVFTCESCGGELVTTPYTAATICPFCGSPAILKERLAGSGRPDSLIPFAFDKDKAKAMFRDWTRRGFFTPKGFYSRNTLESITGEYVPYWLFDLETDVHMEASATRVRVTRKGDHEYTYTDHYRLLREVKMNFERIPADASQKLPDDTMERLEPFSYQELREFEPPYLAGYQAECSNFAPEELQPEAEERAKRFALQATENTMGGYATVAVTSSGCRQELRRKEYALLPVWVLRCRYRGSDWYLYLNGQTGRRIGKLPIDKGRVAVCYTVMSVLITVISALIWGIVR